MRKKISVLLICCLTIVCTATTCYEDNTEEVNFYIRNQSDETIWINYFFINDTTALLEPGRSFQLQDPIELTIGDTYLGSMNAGMFERGFNYQIIVFKQSTWDKYTKEELIEKNIYYKLYILSKDDLIKLHYIVVYTGKE